MKVSDGMTPAILSVGPSHTLQQAAQMMAERNVGSAVVLDPESPGPGIITERDVLRAVARSEDAQSTMVADHHADDLTVAHPDWSLEEAAATMMRGGFRHLIVCDDEGEVVGILSMRDIVRIWVSERLSAM